MNLVIKEMIDYTITHCTHVLTCVCVSVVVEIQFRALRTLGSTTALHSYS